MTACDDWSSATESILDALDLVAEYRLLGVDVTGDAANENGWIECRAMGRTDTVPSAGINISRQHPQRGRYKEFVGDGDNLSFFDFAARYGQFEDWKAARKHYADQTKTTLPKSKESRPQDKLHPKPWNDAIAESWCLKKTGVEIEAVRLAGASLAQWPARGKNNVIAFPSFGPDGEDGGPVGFAIYGSTGRDLPLKNKSGEVSRKKMLIVGGSQRGWLGLHGLRILRQAEVVWKCEGTTDLLAVQSAILRDAPELRDRHAVISNTNGSNEVPQDELISMLADKVVYVMHDADVDGQSGVNGNGGGLRWARRIAEFADEVRFPKLPYPVEPNHGRDVRDWLNEGHTYQDLLLLAEAAEVIEVDEESEGRPETAIDQEITASIGLDVLGETEGGKVQVFSDFHRKTDTIADIGKLTTFRLTQICGHVVRERVHTGADEIPGVHKLVDVKNAIANLAGYRRLDDHPAVGCGVWRGKTTDGDETSEVVVVGSGQAAALNGDGNLRLVTRPRHDGLLLDLGTSDPWYNHEELASMVAACDEQFSAAVVDDLEELFARWEWSNQGQCPKIVVGMLLATWVQTIWDWRPQIYLTGASNTGKTTLFSALADMFGRLAMKTSNSSAAGIRQRISKTASVVLCDEFESSKYQKDIIEMIRASGRGDDSFRGTTGNQRGLSFRLQHIFWSAAVNPSLKKETDWNRAIRLELIPPPAGRMGKLNLPSSGELRHLGQRALAVALRIALQAKKVAAEIGQRQAAEIHQATGTHPRIVESYAVPAACYGISVAEDPAGVLERMLENLAQSSDQSEVASDEDRLIEDILTAVVRTRTGDHSVATLISRNWTSEGEIPVPELLGRVGIGVFSLQPSMKFVASRAKIGNTSEILYLFVHCASVERYLLRDTDWQDQKIATILKRIEGVTPRPQRLNAKLTWGVMIPFTSLPDFGNDDQDEFE